MPQPTPPPGPVYVHGYDDRERERLEDQAGALVSLLHRDTRYPARSRVLEAGCGVGAQTVTLAMNSPDAEIVSIDISPDSVNAARQRLADEGITNVEVHVGDLVHVPFPDASFDIEGIRMPTLAAQLMTAERFDAGVAALHRTASLDGMFSYMFFKGTARVE